jgi:acyl-ACP thioesterase
MAMQVLEKEYRVHVYETGPDGRVSLQSLFNFMQDIASEHAVLLGYGRDDLMRENHFWVLSRMYAVISSLPAWSDTIVAKTWPAGVDKLFAMRNYDLADKKGVNVAYASSAWLIIDRDTKKIQRPDEFLRRYDRENQNIQIPVRYPVKLREADENGTLSPAFRVKVGDLDINLHTNNVNYLRWVTDTYDLNFILKHRPRSAEINYLAEAVFSDEVMVRTSAGDTDGRSFSHSVISQHDRREYCRVRIEWEETGDKV